jgi:G8 domain
MKKLYSVILVIFTVSFTFANPVINATANNGNWKSTSTWNLNRVPKDGDTVVIPAGKTVVINNNQNLSSDFLYIEVYGTLKFSGGKLWLNNNSTVIIYSGGSVTGTGNSSETLRINGDNKYWGHVDGTISGPAIANKTTGTSPLGFNLGIIPLPVKFIGFSLARQNNDVLVQWATAEEANSNYYEVQRSDNGSDWNTIATLAAAGSTTLTHSYSYTDKNITAQAVYYRIRQVDIDGQFAITAVRMLKKENGNTEIKAYSTSNSIYVNFSEKVRANVIVRLISMSGQIVSQKILNEPAGQVIVPIQNTMKGVYVVTIANGQNLKFSKQVLL